jgi:hypothetical protein
MATFQLFRLVPLMLAVSDAHLIPQYGVYPRQGTYGTSRSFLFYYIISPRPTQLCGRSLLEAVNRRGGDHVP